MTKKEFAQEVANKAKITLGEAELFVEAYNKTVKNVLNTGEDITMRGFGTYKIVRRAEKTGQNISKGTKVLIPAHNAPKLKFAKDFIK